MQVEVLVIGAGPAGLMAAGRAAGLGASVLVLEKNRSPGRKLSITGGGRCNIFNAEPDLHRLVRHFGAGGKRLLSALSEFGPEQAAEFFTNLGLPLKTEAENRVFPVSESAPEVRDKLAAWAQSSGAVIRTQAVVRSLDLVGKSAAQSSVAGSDGSAAQGSPGPRFAVRLADGSKVNANIVILACGGTARPETGSSGDGFPWLEALGHSVLRPAPILVPVKLAEPWVASLMGVKLADAAISFDEPDAAQNGKIVRVRRRGKLLFTHFGLSGPLVLNASASLELASRGGRNPGLEIDLLPGSPREELEARILAAVAESPKKRIAGLVAELLPTQLAARVCEQAGVPQKTLLAELTRIQRTALLQVLRGLKVTYAGQLGPEKAIVSRGGVHLDQVDFRSMESLIVPGLYIVGDLLDFDRPSGGFSLQICWSSGWRAGAAAAAALAERQPRAGFHGAQPLHS